MLIKNIKKINKKDLFYCYSENLYKFLRFENNIEPVSFFENDKNSKYCYIFVKSKRLKKCLDEWGK